MPYPGLGADVVAPCIDRSGGRRSPNQAVTPDGLALESVLPLARARTLPVCWSRQSELEGCSAMALEVVSLHAAEILDSRGRPTLSVELPGAKA
jgi:hypothetical protein